MDAEISAKDMTGLLKNANDLFYGKGHSGVLKYYYDNIGASKKATRINTADMIYDSQIEYAFNLKFKNYNAFQQQKNAAIASKNSYWMYLPLTGIIEKKSDGTVGMFDLDKDCKDMESIRESGEEGAVLYATLAYNKLTDDRIMTFFDDSTFRPLQVLNVKDAIIIAYNYYYSLTPIPVYTNVTQVGTYNKNIITDELLHKTTNLPDASNNHLPSWKGVNLQYAATMAGCGEESNFWITEAQIRAMADMKANFLRLWISFAQFEGPAYGNKDKVNMYYIEHLDQIVAWCMKYNIHIQFSIVNGPGLDRGTMPDVEKDLTEQIFSNKEYRNQFLKWYRMLARRYSVISNKYTSINLMNEPRPKDDQNYADTFSPIIKAIWEEAPNRVIVADVHQNTTGEAIAKLGVALSCHTYEPSDILVVTKNGDQTKYKNAVWPIVSMPATIYSQEGAEWYKYTDEVWKRGNIITGDISGIIKIMTKDISHGNAVLCVKADNNIIYNKVPEYICPGGNIEEDNCYSEKPLVLTIPKDTKQIEISCSSGILSLSSVIIEREDGITVDIPCISDNWSGTPPVTITIDEKGSFKGSAPALNAEKVLNTRYNGIQSIIETKKLAERCGVGFMVGEVGMYGDYFLNYVVPDETVFTYFKDMLTTLEKNNIPYATGWLIDRYGPITTYPYYKDRTYKKLDGAECYYIDTKMYELFKKLMNN